MEMSDFTAGRDDDGRRIDRVLRRLAPGLPLPEIYRALRKGLIRLNGRKACQDNRVVQGDIISIADFLLKDTRKPENKEKSLLNETGLPPVVFENSHIIIFNKPAGITVQGYPDSIDRLFLAYYREHYGSESLSFFPGPLHRLDRHTSGLLAFSKSLEGARWFSEKIQAHEIKKIYTGIVCGRLEGEQLWSDFIEEAPVTRGFHTVRVYGTEKQGAKQAVTRIRALKQASYGENRLTLAEFELETGRKHQIRAQSAFHSHPLFGDTAYGAESAGGLLGGRLYLLHAQKLLFPDNPIGLPAEISCPPDLTGCHPAGFSS